MKEQTSKTNDQQVPEKISYQKPEVTEIELVALDVLATTCTEGSSNGTTGSCLN